MKWLTLITWTSYLRSPLVISAMFMMSQVGHDRAWPKHEVLCWTTTDFPVLLFSALQSFLLTLYIFCEWSLISTFGWPSVRKHRRIQRADLEYRHAVEELKKPIIAMNWIKLIMFIFLCLRHACNNISLCVHPHLSLSFVASWCPQSSSSS